MKGTKREDAILVVGVQVLQAHLEFAEAWFMQAKDGARVRARLANAALPRVPCGQIYGRFATAELGDNPEERHANNRP